MYINNDKNIFIISNLWLAKEYFKQMRQTLDSLYHLLFSDQTLPFFLSPEYFLPLIFLVFLSSRSSSETILHRSVFNIPRLSTHTSCFISSLHKLPTHTSSSASSIPKLSTHTSQTKLFKVPVKVKPCKTTKTQLSGPSRHLKRLCLPILEL